MSNERIPHAGILTKLILDHKTRLFDFRGRNPEPDSADYKQDDSCDPSQCELGTVPLLGRARM
jgi:hypothetical protein